MTDPAEGGRVWGKFFVIETETGKVVHKVDCHYPEDSVSWRRLEAGLLLRVDTERFYVAWEPGKVKGRGVYS